MNRLFDFYTYYKTFFLTSDNGSAIKTAWFEDQNKYFSDRLLQAQNLLAIRTESYGHIKGEIIMLTHDNNQFDYKNYDHIIEGGIEVRSGILQVLDCPGSQVEFEIRVEPGTYRIRIYSSGLQNTDMDEDEGNDYYKIEIWPDNNIEPKILKRYNRM